MLTIKINELESDLIETELIRLKSDNEEMLSELQEGLAEGNENCFEMFSMINKEDLLIKSILAKLKEAKEIKEEAKDNDNTIAELNCIRCGQTSLVLQSEYTGKELCWKCRNKMVQVGHMIQEPTETNIIAKDNASEKLDTNVLYINGKPMGQIEYVNIKDIKEPIIIPGSNKLEEVKIGSQMQIKLKKFLKVSPKEEI